MQVCYRQSQMSSSLRGKATQPLTSPILWPSIKLSSTRSVCSERLISTDLAVSRNYLTILLHSHQQIAMDTCLDTACPPQCAGEFLGYVGSDNTSRDTELDKRLLDLLQLILKRVGQDNSRVAVAVYVIKPPDWALICRPMGLSDRRRFCWATALRQRLLRRLVLSPRLQRDLDFFVSLYETCFIKALVSIKHNYFDCHCSSGLFADYVQKRRRIQGPI